MTKYENGVASTADFIALASKVAGRDLGAFLHAWLYDETTPPMPGHPDWTVDPVTAPEPVPAASIGRSRAGPRSARVGRRSSPGPTAHRGRSGAGRQR